MWRVIDMRNKGWEEHNPERLYRVFRRAVDLSQGQLIDVHFEYFANNEWLSYLTQRAIRGLWSYIADKRSVQLRRLRITSCSGIEGKDLAKSVLRFPLLEELHISCIRISVSARFIEAIGHSCSKLKAFTFDHEGFSTHKIVSDSLALAVAKSMPGLLHLRLFGNKLSNKGLQSILDGCPVLESLDIQNCFNINLEGDLGERCSQQIKSVKHSLDSTDNQWFPVHDSDSESFYWHSEYEEYDSDSDYNLADCDYEEYNCAFYDTDTGTDISVYHSDWNYFWCFAYDDYRSYLYDDDYYWSPGLDDYWSCWLDEVDYWYYTDDDFDCLEDYRGVSAEYF